MTMMMMMLYDVQRSQKDIRLVLDYSSSKAQKHRILIDIPQKIRTILHATATQRVYTYVVSLKD